MVRPIVKPITVLAINSLKVGQSLTDGALPSGNGRLILEYRKDINRKVWVFRYRKGKAGSKMEGAPRLGEYGDPPRMNINAARDKAHELIQLVKRGIDPKSAIQDERNNKRTSHLKRRALGTFEGLLEAYWVDLAEKSKPSARDTESTLKLHVVKPFPHLCSLPANEIKPEHITEILARMIKKGIKRRTNMVRTMLSAAFVAGAKSDNDPLRMASKEAIFKITSNPVQLVARQPQYEIKKTRVLSDDELRFYWRALEKESAALRATAKFILLAGGQRITQTLRCQWADYDPTSLVIRLLDGKGMRDTPIEHLLPVTPSMKQELDLLAQLNGVGHFIFSSTSGAKPFHNTTLSSLVTPISKRFESHARESGILAEEESYKGFTAGDLRRSVETRMQSFGIGRELRAQTLSHGRKSGVQAQHYEQYEYLSEKEEVLTQWQRHLSSVIDGTYVAATVLKPKFGKRA